MEGTIGQLETHDTFQKDFGVAMSPRSASDRPSCPDKPRGPKAVVLATAAMVLAVPLFSQPASWNRTIHKLHVYLAWDIAITF